MKYSETAPSRKAGKLIKCYWTLEDDGESDYSPEPIVPDGCPEMVFNLDTPFRRYFEGGVEDQPISILVGQMKGAVTIMPSGRVALFGIKFWPFGLYHILCERVDQVTGKIESAADVFGSLGERLEERINQAESTEKRIEAVEAEFKERFSSDSKVTMSTIAALQLIEANPNQVRINRIAELAGVGLKKLERDFKKEIGLTPKFYSRIVRVKNLVEKTMKSSEPNWTDIAYAYGFSDQSHFIREFKAFTGTVPRAFAAQSKKLSDLFAG